MSITIQQLIAPPCEGTALMHFHHLVGVLPKDRELLGRAAGPRLAAANLVAMFAAGMQAAPALELCHEGAGAGHRGDGVAVLGRLDVDAVERVGRPRPERPHHRHQTVLAESPYCLVRRDAVR